jgi:hypothetical protein
MAAFTYQLTRFEKLLLRIALLLGTLLVVARVGAMLFLAILKHSR